ncbi:MAG TPA: VWA domain-containing protein [Blastocatellia bacterium]|nr:VWA domain-containing protein [Blastocatellia bacterium]
MRLLSSSALWWLLLAAIIVFFYLLKLRRKRTVVPSVLLWTRALEEIEANAPFKKLRRSLLLLLQLLALVALVFALARPLVNTRALASGSTLIIIDSTASMSARDEDGSSRLDRAKKLAREMIEGLTGGDRAAIIESSARVGVRSALTSDRGALAAAIADVHATDAPGNLADALRLAEQIARSERDASVVIISDGGGSPIASEPESPLELSARTTADSRAGAVRFLRVGRRSDNIGIIAMNSRQFAGSSRREVFASIVNFGDRARTFGVELKLGGKLIDARTLDLGANDRRGLVFDSAPSQGALAELKLDVEDDLAADNVAYAFLPTARTVRVGVIGENPFLLEALAANADLAASKISASSNTSEFDCIVSDGAGVIETNRPLLAINPPDAEGLWRATGQRDHPDITSVERSHPVNSFLSYGDLHVEHVASHETASWLRPIVSAGSDPLIWAGDDGRRRIVMIGFDLARSDLPLKVEFPILLANAMFWLAGRDSPATERAVRAGQPATIQTSAPSAAITTPAGETREVVSRDGSVVFADTLRVGMYDVKDAPPFAASLLSEAESNTSPLDSIRTRGGETKGQMETFHSEREAWRWIALFALAVLMIEWWAYHRRIV